MKNRVYGVTSQVIIVLTFFAGMWLNYFLISPVVIEEETGRYVGDQAIFFSYFQDNLPDNEEISGQMLEQLYPSASKLDNYNSELFVIGQSDGFVFNTVSIEEEGSASSILEEKYGKSAGKIMSDELREPRGNGRIVYESKTNSFYFTRYDGKHKLLFFCATEYKKAESDAASRFLMLFGIMLAGGILIILISFRNFRKVTKRTLEEAIVQQDLDTASEIQQSMLPHRNRQLMQVDIDAQIIPAQKVGGDLYYYFLRNGLLYFCVGDVSGKGMPAALCMSRAVTIFRNMAIEGKTPCEIAVRLNEELCYNNDKNIFLTAFIGAVGVYDGHMVYCNAGHDEPLYWSGKEGSTVEFLKTSENLPLGFDTSSKYVERSMNIGDNSMLLLYTDGINEARDRHRKLYGNERLRNFIEGAKELSSKEINDALIKDVNNFASGVQQSDDITLLTLRNIARPKALQIRNEIGELKKLRLFLEEIFRECPLDTKDLIKVRAGLDEAVTNVVRYAYTDSGDIELTAGIVNKELVFTLKDSGIEFNPLTFDSGAPSSEVLRVGGMGIPIMKASFDSIEYQRTDCFNKLIMKKKL